MHNLKIQNEPSLIKDIQSSAVVNTDLTGYQNYINQRKKMGSEKEKISEIENNINMLASELSEIKNSIRKILDTINTSVISNRE